MENCEYSTEGVEYSKPPSSLLEYGNQFFLSADNVISNPYPAEKTDKKGSGLNNMGEDVARKKLSHNANERHRRKNLNVLYGKLRSLLPHSNLNMKKKVSNPDIVSGILKYIPQLEREIKSLSRQRAELFTAFKDRRISEQPLKTAPADHAYQMLTNKLGFSESPNAVLTEVSIVATGPALLLVVQTPHVAPVLFSRVLLLFEEERLEVINASTFISDEKAWHSIQVKAIESIWRLDISALRLKIIRLCEHRGGHFLQKASDCFQA